MIVHAIDNDMIDPSAPLRKATGGMGADRFQVRVTREVNMEEKNTEYESLENSIHNDNSNDLKQKLDKQTEVLEYINQYAEETKWPLPHLAALYGAYSCLEYLIQLLRQKLNELGVSYENIQAYIHSPNAYGETPLHIAVEKDHLKCAEILLKEGADPNCINEYEYCCLAKTPLYIACYRDNLEMVKLLLKYGGDLNQEIKGCKQLLHRASLGNAYHCAAFLLEHGADVNAKDNDACTPLYYAQSIDNGPEITALLLEHGAEVNTINYHDETPLHSAARHNLDQSIELLLEHGADINALDCYHNTPLQVSMRRTTTEPLYNKHGEAIDYTMEYQEKAFRALLNHHPDLEIYNEDGETPLLYAAAEDEEEIMEALLAHGADIHARLRNSQKTLIDILLDQNDSIVDFMELFVPHRSKEDIQYIMKELFAHGVDIHTRERYYPKSVLDILLEQNYTLETIIELCGSCLNEEDIQYLKERQNH